jgi:hypothetical protein
MNSDHPEDNLLIVRAYVDDDASAATMTGFDSNEGRWNAVIGGVEKAVHVAWPTGPIYERAEVRREIVSLYEGACERLGVEARPL